MEPKQPTQFLDVVQNHPELLDEFDYATAEHLEMYREYCSTELSENRDIPTFTEFRNLMNE